MSDKPIKLLLVDEESMSTSMEMSAYREMGIQTYAESDLSNVIGSIHKKSIDVIVINIDSKSLSALSLCKKIRAEKINDHIPIVITSVESSNKQKNILLDAGASLFVEQPLPRSAFVEKIKQLLSKDTRHNDRLENDYLGKVSIIIGDKSISAPIADISLSGMLVNTEIEFEEKGICTLEFNLPGINKSLKIESEIVRRLEISASRPTHKAGIGIRFTNFTDNSEKLLQDFFDQNSKQINEHLVYYL